MMTFTHEGKDYQLRFYYGEGEIHDPPNKQPQRAPRKYRTVKAAVLVKHDDKWGELQSRTVYCRTELGDTYSQGSGRLEALKKLMDHLKKSGYVKKFLRELTTAYQKGRPRVVPPVHYQRDPNTDLWSARIGTIEVNNFPSKVAAIMALEDKALNVLAGELERARDREREREQKTAS